jgi:hypothetical protein
MLNKIKALVNNKGIDVNDIIEVQDNQLFIVGNKEYYVLTDEEAQEIYEEMQRDFIKDLGLEEFTLMAQEYIINNCLKIDWFNEGMIEYYQNYIDDMYEDELQEELDNYEVENEEELLECYTGSYSNGLQFYQEMYSSEELMELIERENLLDINKVIEYCQDIDGRGNIISSYDGEEDVEEVDNIDYYIYRIN